MASIKVIHDPSSIKGLAIIEPTVYWDSRGYFVETYNRKNMLSEGLDLTFVQDNQSKSRKGVVRGLHFQKKYPQGKLIRVILGSIYDVAVDLRRGSPTYGSYHGITLTHTNNLQFYIPKGFAHGFMVLSDEAVVAYKCTDFYRPEDEGGLAWDDPDIAIDWPLEEIGGLGAVLLSDKDKANLTFKEIDEIGYEFVR